MMPCRFGISSAAPTTASGGKPRSLASEASTPSNTSCQRTPSSVTTTMVTVGGDCETRFVASFPAPALGGTIKQLATANAAHARAKRGNCRPIRDQPVSASTLFFTNADTDANTWHVGSIPVTTVERLRQLFLRRFLRRVLLGTFAPAARASERAMAMACL